MIRNEYGSKLKWLAIGFVPLLSLMAGCAQQEEPPEMPPQLSFVVDYDSFPSEAAAKVQSGAPSYAAGTDFVYSAANVLVWKIITDVGMIVPVTSFKVALAQTPRQEGDNWVWSYNFNILTNAYTARLVRSVASDGIHWDMYLSLSAGASSFTDYHWYSGVHNEAMTSGYWLLKKSPTEDFDILRIDWMRDTATNTSTIKYTNVMDAANGTAAEQLNIGEYIEYGSTVADATTGFDAYFTINLRDAGGVANVTAIEWSRTGSDGRVADAGHYSDGGVDAAAWHCWDTTLANVTCPVP